MRILALSATVLALAGPAFATAQPAALDAAAGDWRLSEVGGKVACTLTLTRQTSLTGYEVKAPMACRRAFPPLKTVAAWAPDDKGGIVLSDAQAKTIIAFPAQPGQAAGALEARAPDGKTWRLESLRAAAVVTPAKGRMSGDYRLTAIGGATLCDLTFRADMMFATRGPITAVACTPAWGDKKLAYWSMRAGKLSLMDRDGKTILVMKPGDPGVYVVADPKADLVTLSRRTPPPPTPPTPAPSPHL
jgi:hypothetical protein